RKKVRCPGERPACSFCQRLGQPCDYNPAQEPTSTQDADNANLRQRMETLEMKLDQVLQSLSLSTTSQVRRLYQNQLESQTSIQAQTGQNITTIPSSEDRQLCDAGQLYLTCCHHQPLCLFREEGFLDTLQDRDHELRLAIQMLSYRFPPGQLTQERQPAAAALFQSCRKFVVDRIAQGKVKLSTLQTLCLLSMTEFSDGDVMQAGLDLDMAQYFVNSLPMGSSLGDPDEYSLCVQSILLLQSLQGSIPDLAKAVSVGSLFHNANRLLELINRQTEKIQLLRDPSLDAVPGGDPGILSYMAQAAEVWHMARAYAAMRVGPDSPPPWSHQSDYSLIMQRQLELDCRFPLKYRFATNHFGELAPETLHQRRDYWVPWLFIQFLHAGIPTLINHPFLLSLRLKNFRHMMPQTFMCQSFDLISKHTAWTICYLDLLEKQKFQVTDPTIAHCVVIVATIHLQHSFVEDETLRKKAQHGYDKCMRFLDRVGPTWPFIFSMTQNLRKLRDSITTAPTMGPQDTQSQRPWSIDAQLLWDILIFEKAGRSNASTDRSLFDDVITPDSKHPQDVVECALVGSAGVSGHKTAWRQFAAYAPQDNDPYTPLFKIDTPGTVSGVDERIFEGLGNMDAMDQGDYLLQAEDFGRAVKQFLFKKYCPSFCQIDLIATSASKKSVLSIFFIDRIISQAETMRINDITVFNYDANYRYGTYSMSHGRLAKGQKSIVVRIRTEDGVEGWAETAPLGSDYLPSSFTGELAAIKELGPQLLGMDPRSPAAINEVMDRAMMGAMAAKAVIDMACWDLLGKSQGLPTATLFGGVLTEKPPAFSVIGIRDVESAISQANDELTKGAVAMQLKAGDDPLADARRVRAIRHAIPEHVRIWADANGGWTLDEALTFARAVGQDITVGLEQPCRTLSHCAEVGRRTGLPIILDESIVTVADLFEAHAAGIAGVNIKPSRVGGLTKARTIRDAAAALDMVIACDDTWGSALTTAQNVLLATTTPSRVLRAVDLFAEWTEPLIADVPRMEADGRITPSQVPGNGHGAIRLDLLGEPLFQIMV
ncbi:hypothetical protein BGZ63DRAFT_350398, partial [Mariannaea sp. PMI_226]